MKPAIVSVLVLVSSPSFVVLAAQPADESPVSTRIAVRAETITNQEAGPVTPCEAQAKSATNRPPFAFWSTLGEADPSENAGFKLRDTAGRCGEGIFPSAFPYPSGTNSVPFLINEISVTVGWDAGAMDPGPGAAFWSAITVTTRWLAGFTPDRKPLYGAPVMDRRSVRLEEGEEYLMPVRAADASVRELLGVHEVLVRIRIGWAGRADATDYGAIAVAASAPGSEILLDRGLAGHVGADGAFLLANVPVGQREVRIRGTSGPAVARWISVVKGRTVVVSPEARASGTPAQPTVAPAGKNAEGFLEYRRKRDGAIMVQIPEGEFLMGNLKTEGGPLPHTVYVSSFLMDKLPVTVGLYKRCAAATGRPLPPDPYWGVHDNFPVAFVRWDEGKAYCEWAGGRLPTEAEREKATRGTDGRMWPWGDEPPPSPSIAVFRRNWGQEGNDAAGIRPAGASPYGLLDTGGNMWEWCEDWWDAAYFKSSPKKDPRGPKVGRARVVKGGSWDSRPSVLSASSRNFGYIGYREGDFGFRCAADPPR